MRYALLLLVGLALQVFLFRQNMTFSTAFYDKMQKSFSASTSQSQIAIIHLSQASLDQLKQESGISWPINRELYGQIALAASKLKAKGLAFDIIMDDLSKYGVADDQGANELFKMSKIPLIFPAKNISGSIHPPFKVLIENVSGVSFGSVAVNSDTDGVYRRILMVADTLPPVSGADSSTQSQPVKSLGAELVGMDESESIRAGNGIYFYRPDMIVKREFYEVVSLGNQIANSAPYSLDEFKNIEGKYWIVGYSAPGLKDIKATSVNPTASGMEIHAHHAQNLLDGIYIRKPSFGLFVLIAILLNLSILLLLVRSRVPVWAVAGGSLLTGLLCFGLPILFWQFQVFLDPGHLSIGAVLILLGGLGYKFTSEWRDQLRLAKTVESSMSKEIVKLIKSGKMNLTRFGQRKNISILFSDLAGFTTIAESMDPVELVEVLNLYLEEVVNLIFEHQGFVDKFIGDAVMALWGAPLVGQDNHAELALKTALEFDAAVNRFNQKVKILYPKIKVDFEARVGVHQGDAVVGNMGSSKRHNYTAIGDNVNLASRLEGMGKNYFVRLIVSHEILQSAPQFADRFFLIDEIQVKGRAQATKIYTVRGSFEAAQIAHYEKGFALYQKELWLDAVAELKLCPAILFSKELSARCQAANDHGPPKAYLKGVWKHDSK